MCRALIPVPFTKCLTLLFVVVLGICFRLSDEKGLSYDECACVFPDFLEVTVLRETSNRILQSQQSTKVRIEVILNEIASFLESFDVEIES
jgi:hypothetical protein